MGLDPNEYSSDSESEEEEVDDGYLDRLLDEHPDKYRSMTFMQLLPHILTHAQVRSMSMEERERVFDQWKERNSVELIDEHRG